MEKAPVDSYLEFIQAYQQEIGSNLHAEHVHL